MMRERELLLWDWDDVLADGLSLQRLALRQAYGDGPWEDALPEYPLPDEWAEILEHFDQDPSLMNKEMSLLLRQFLPSRPGAQAVLTELAERWRMVLVASTPQETLELYLRQAGIIDIFEGAYGGDKLQRGKPSEEIFLRALDSAGVAEESALLLVGSAPAARAAGNLDYWLRAGRNVLVGSDAARNAEKIFWELRELPRWL